MNGPREQSSSAWELGLTKSPAPVYPPSKSILFVSTAGPEDGSVSRLRHFQRQPLPGKISARR